MQKGCPNDFYYVNSNNGQLSKFFFAYSAYGKTKLCVIFGQINPHCRKISPYTIHQDN